MCHDRSKTMQPPMVHIQLSEKPKLIKIEKNIVPCEQCNSELLHANQLPANQTLQCFHSDAINVSRNCLSWGHF